MAGEREKRGPSSLSMVIVAVMAAVGINIVFEGLGEDPLRRLAFLLVFATLGAVITVAFIKGLGAAFRRATSQHEGRKK